MDDLNFSQQDKIFEPDMAQPLTLIGAGAVGSHLALHIAKLGCPRLTVYDRDSVSSHNVPMSAYGHPQVGMTKVLALQELLMGFANVPVDPRSVWFTDQELKGSVACCVDTMKARFAVWDRVKKNPLVDVLIDTRIQAVYGEVYCIRPNDDEDIELYEKHLVDDPSVMVTQSCGRHGIGYVTQLTAAHACYLLAQSWKGKLTDSVLRFSLGKKPFFTTINNPKDSTKTRERRIGDMLLVDLRDDDDRDFKGEY